MILSVSYLYDTSRREFLTDEEKVSCQDIGYFSNPSPDGKEWEVSTFHGTAVRVRYDGPVNQLSALVMRGGAELVAALNGDSEARYITEPKTKRA
jgi:hypothetical protein